MKTSSRTHSGKKNLQEPQSSERWQGLHTSLMEATQAWEQLEQTCEKIKAEKLAERQLLLDRIKNQLSDFGL